MFLFNVWRGYIFLHFLKKLKLSRLINIKSQHKSVRKVYALFIWIINMHYILYFISKLWNNTEVIDLPKQSISHTYIYTHQNFSLSYSHSEIPYIFYMLFDSLLWPDSFMISKLLPSQSIFCAFIHDHTNLLAFTATVLLKYWKFANKNRILPF